MLEEHETRRPRPTLPTGCSGEALSVRGRRLAARPLAVFTGKLLFNLILLLALECIVVPLYCILMGYQILGLTALVTVLLAGGVALAITTTTVAAIISRASGSGTLFAVLTVPLALPLLVLVIQGTRAAATNVAFVP